MARDRCAAKRISKETVSTIGEAAACQLRAAADDQRTAFIELVTADQPEAPAYFTYDAVLNSRERPTLDQALARELKPLTLEQLRAAVRERCADARHARPGGVRRGASRRQHQHRARRPVRDVGRHAARSSRQPIVIVADPGAETQSALRLGRIGFDQVVGISRGGLAAVGEGGPRRPPDVIVRPIA